MTPGRTTRPAGRALGLPLLAGVLLLAGAAVGSGPATGQERAGATGPGANPAAPPAAADTIMTRADSARARILERLRGGERERPDSLPPDTADTLRAAPTLGPAQGGVRRVEPIFLPEGADSVMQALSRLPGYSIATYRGRRADVHARDGRLVLEGTPEERALFAGRGTRVEADSSIVFDDATGRVRTTGMSRFTASGEEPVESRALIYDIEAARGSAYDATTRYTQGATWYVRGDLDSVEQGRLFGTSARFTSCELDPPHSHFQASELKVVGNQVLVARGVRMYVEDVPVFWLPFIAQNLGSGRASGLLTPRFSLNDVVRTSTGYNRRLSNVGYYWAMSDYSDMTVALDWFSNHYTALTAGLRYSWRRQFLNGRANVRRYWREGGGREFALDTGHDWQISERTRANASGRYVTSSAFVTQHTFDPREVTQTIDSNAGLSHRFDWGNLSLTANRRQYLTDERVDMTLPTASLSLSTMTLFPAPPAQASWYNNLSLGGALRYTRQTYDRETQPDTAFTLSRADQTRTQASMNASAGLGNLNLGGRIDYEENVFADVPGVLLPGGVPAATVAAMGGFPAGDGLPPELDPFLDAHQLGGPVVHDDFSRATARWSTSLGYRQQLIGSTTLTPSVSVSGELVRSDSIAGSGGFIPGPRRTSFGARLQTDVYGFYGGVADFAGIRHKITPSVRFDYSPAVTPTARQRDVFGARVAHPRQIVTLGLNQTWEARLPEPDDPDPSAAEESDPEGDDPPAQEPPEVDDPMELLEELPLPGDDLDPDEPEESLAPAAGRGLDDTGLRRAPRAQVVTLLALNTTAVTYDIVEADSTGEFLRGFQTTRLGNTIRSDYLQGLDLSFEHDLFEDPPFGEEGSRRFAPHLSRLSLGFRLDHRSGVARAVRGLLGIEAPSADDPVGPATDPGPEVGAPEGAPPEEFDPDRIVPGGDGMGDPVMRREGWSARISYSLRRPRGTGAGQSVRAQMLQWGLSFAPTPHWDATWNSSYDVEARRFNDHMVTLRRDLHEWEATFGFRQTATGNWAFSFEVSLRANRDLRFDYEQRSTETGAGLPGGPPFD